MPQAKGSFEVKIVPLPPDPDAPDTTLGRMSLDKQIHGDLEATGKGQMLTAGTLHGRSGSFVLQHHTGIMTRGQSQLTIAVVPDSGTG